MDPASECADRLRALANKTAFAARADDLRSVADELVDDDLDSWVGVDLVAAFPPDASIDLPPRDQAPRYLAVLAGVSVFAPVAWTWFSLRQASQAHLEMLEDRDGPVEDTFLSLWISGFDNHLATIHRLGPVTLVSVLLIFLAAALVAAHRITAARADRDDESRERAAASSLVRELSTAQRLLNTRRSDDPARVEAVVKRSVKELLAANKATQLTAQDMRDAADSVGTVLTTLTTATEDARTSTLATSEAADRLANSSVSTGQAIDDALKRFLAGVNSHLADLRRETSEVIVKSGEATQASASLVSSAVNQVGATQHELARHLAELSDTGRNAGGAITVAMDSMQRTMRDVDDSLARHESAMQAQASELTAARDALERALRVLEDMATNASNGRAR